MGFFPGKNAFPHGSRRALFWIFLNLKVTDFHYLFYAFEQVFIESMTNLLVLNDCLQSNSEANFNVKDLKKNNRILTKFFHYIKQNIFVFVLSLPNNLIIPQILKKINYWSIDVWWPFHTVYCKSFIVWLYTIIPQ